MQLREVAREHLLLHFSRNGDFGPDGSPLLVLDRGDGAHVYDIDGRRYVDGLSSLFCAQLGYSYGAEMADAASVQLNRLAFNTVWSTAHPPVIELADRLANLSPPGLNKVFFTSGGSDSVEAAWKIARQYHVANGESSRRKAIARKTAYHGASLGALAFTGVPGAKELFGPPAIPVTHVSNTNSFRAPEGPDEQAFTARLLNELEQAILAEGPETVAVIMAEPVQNAGGCLLPPEGYWAGLREIADRYGVLLIADEVITGFGRLGTMLGSEHVGAQPDLLVMAKGLTSAYAPMGGVLVADRVAAPLYDDRRFLLHGVTFGGHPLSAAIALRNLEIFERDGILENVRAIEPHLRARLEELRELPIVGDIRGTGFFWAVELVKDGENARFTDVESDQLVRRFIPQKLLEAGLIARGDDRGDTVLHIAPPLISDKQVIDEIVDAMAYVLTAAAEFMAADRSPVTGIRTGALERPGSPGLTPTGVRGSSMRAARSS